MTARQSFSQLETDHLECRSWAHAWEYIVSYVEREGRSSIIELHLHCERCGGDRIDRYNRASGRLMTRRYVYPDGYVVKELKKWGGRRTFNNNVRVELFTRYAKKAKPRKEKRVA